MNISRQGKGLFFVIASGFSWAIAGIISKAMLNSGVTPVLLIIERNIFGTLCLGVLMFIFQRQLFHVDRQDIKTMFICCLVMFVYSAAYFFCIFFMNVSVAVMLLYTYPTIVAVASVFIYKERLTLIIAAALLITLLGLMLTLNFFTADLSGISLPGVILGVFAAIGAAAYCLYVKKLSLKYNSFTINFYGILLTVLGYGVSLPFFELTPLTAMETTVALTAALPYLCGFLLYAVGVKYLRPSFAAIFGTSEAVFNIVLAALLLGELVTVSQIFGVILILGAIVLLSIAPRKNQKVA